MPGFRRVFPSFPGFGVLGNIESTNVIDVAPPDTPLGAGTFPVGLIGEFEDGEVNRPTRVFGATDLANKFGGFGFTHDGVPYSGPVASQSAEATTPWEGNGFLALRNHKYSGLVVTRVDNSAGQVSFSRLACVVGGVAPFNLEPGETISIDVDGGGAAVATFDAARAVRAGAGFPGPAQQVWQVDDDAGPTFVDQTTGFNDATDANLTPFPATEAVGDYFAVGKERPFDSLVLDYANGTAGIGGVVVWEYWNGSAWTALSGVVDGTAGFTTAVADGLTVSWTVPSDWATLSLNSVTAYYVRARITTVYSTNPILDQGFVESDGLTGFLGGETMEISIDGGPTRVIVFTSAQQTLAQVVSYINSVTASDIAVVNSTEFDLRSVVRGTGGTIEVIGGTGINVLGHVVGVSTGTGDVANIDSVTHAEFKAVVEADVAGTVADQTADGNSRVCATTTPGTGTIQVTAVTATGTGFTVGASATSAAVASEVKTIPAGTRVRDTTNTVDWVTTVTTTIPVNSGGPFLVGVRPLLDNDTAPTAPAGSIDTIVDVLDDGFVVSNSADINRLSAAQMDVRYLDAFNATLDTSGVPRDIAISYAARHTANILRFGRENANTATTTGHRARKFVTSPPIGTSNAVATGSTGVGVGANRDQRVHYVYPGVTAFIPEIASRGTAGGTGFTADGVIQLPADAFYASTRSLLPPEENAGQSLSDTPAGAIPALTLEDQYNPEEGGTGLTINNYIAFKSAGVIAPRVDRVAGMIYQSDVTSVDPNVNGALADAKRRYFGDFVIDQLFDIAALYVKKLNTPTRRRAFQGQVEAFLELLLSPAAPDLSRLEAYSVVDDTTAEQRALGFQILNVKIRLYASMDFIVYNLEVGTTVVVDEAA